MVHNNTLRRNQGFQKGPTLQNRWHDPFHCCYCSCHCDCYCYCSRLPLPSLPSPVRHCNFDFCCCRAKQPSDEGFASSPCRGHASRGWKKGYPGQWQINLATPRTESLWALLCRSIVKNPVIPTPEANMIPLHKSVASRGPCIKALEPRTFYFYTNELHFNPEFLGRSQLVGSLASLGPG